MAILRKQLLWPIFLLAISSFAHFRADWSPRISNTTASLRGLHYVGQGVIWASGSNGTILRSEDDGFVWQNCTPPDPKLDFRGIWAWDADRAVVMSSGPGDASRVYSTADGGAHWKLLLTNFDPDGFWDAILFRNTRNGFILGDPVEGRFVFLVTVDGGDHWTRYERGGLDSLKDEGAFAASNSSLSLVPGSSDLLFGTGAPEGARVFRFHGDEWAAAKAPLAGIFSISFRDPTHGVSVGGDYKKPNQREGTAAYTVDGGKTWIASTVLPRGYRSTVNWNAIARYWMASGTNGTDISRDDGKTWTPFQSTGWNALSLPWAVGSEGRIATLSGTL